MGFNRSLFERASGVREGGDFQKFKREIQKITEVSKDSLKARRDEAGKCENSSNKKNKYGGKQKYEYLTKRNEIY